MPWLTAYRDERNESVTTLWLERARSLHGWKVEASHSRIGSKLWIEVRMVLMSLPERRWWVFTVAC